MTTRFRKATAALAVLVVGVLLLAIGGADAARATPPPSFETCSNLEGWYVNPDETSRRPIATEAGLKFVGNDLVHHATAGTVEGLAAGTFVAAPAPDQPSFFSVEVRNADGTGYATLRWNTATGKWNMVTGGSFYENATAAGLVAMTTPAKSSALMSFGIGYTNSPPGTVDTVAKSVTFKGKAYDLTCAPAPSASASASTSASAGPATCSTCHARTDSDQLPLTGVPVGAVIAVGLVLLVGGALAIWAAVRRRPRFDA